MSCTLRALPLLLLPFAGLALPAAAPPSECLPAISRAAAAARVAPELLYALALTESGRAVGGGAGSQPWPWTLNAGGEGAFFASRGEAEAALNEFLAGGRRNVDIGCLQLNWHWHHEAFANASAMMDPGQNADYAARFLRRLYEEKGSWDAAVAAYHSATPELAEIYMNRFIPIYARVMGRDPAAGPGLPLYQGEDGPRPNFYPLLQGGAAGANGSLMPAVDGVRPLIGPV